MRLLAIIVALAALGAVPVLAQPLPDSLRSAGVTQAQWDVVRAQVRVQAQRARISEASLLAAAEAASENLAASGQFDPLALQQAIYEALAEQADQIAELQRRLETLTGDADPGIGAIFADARVALAAGRLTDADRLLAEVAQRDLAAIQQADAEAERRRLRAGETIASRGQVAFVQADYLGAAAHYARAAEIAPQPAVEAVWRYRFEQARAVSEQGYRFVEAERLVQAAALFEDVVLPLATRETRPDGWARTLYYLGWVRIRLGERGDNDALTLAERDLLSAAETYSVLGDRPGEARALRALAWLHLTQGRRGGGTDGLERSISESQSALALIDRETSPSDWAATQNTLGFAYSLLGTRGDAAALERAVAAYEAALTVRTREADPEGWAGTQINLGAVFGVLAGRGAPGAYERAVEAYEAALSVMTRDIDPNNWAIAQNNLGIALRGLGARGAPGAFERAIAAFEAALEVRTRDEDPGGWAQTMDNLGDVLRNMGERGAPGALERAVSAYEAALEVRTRDQDPWGWAGTYESLGTVLSILGERGVPGALERAVLAFESALTVWTRESSPANWAQAQMSLGLALQRQGEIDRAVAAYEAALTVRTREADPAAWALTQMNLANALQAQARRGVPGALERAISLYTAALTVQTRETDPANWALTQSNLGNALILEGSPGALERALTAFEAALTVRTREANPAGWARTTYNLATAYRAMGRVREARAAAQGALAAFEQVGNAYFAGQARAFIAALPTE
ncbi:MAG: hypothetical protein AB7Q23_11810 [Hyphomonadaceae bacterium]